MACQPERAREFFLDAVQIGSPEERSAFLDRSCGEDSDLRRRVEALIAAHERPESLLDKAAVAIEMRSGDSAATGNPQSLVESSGTFIGPYKLLQPIGEGGMGTVYMAEQTQPVRRTIALKLIKAGMDSRQVLARFGAERQALALMDHPNIAKVFDAGTTETGRPYFVMELVNGIPITKFCDERRLTLRERLELAIPVCQAVQHAHQKGIIHRDLKPSNVLVALYDGKPVPKVIDFGVAKATGPRLTDQTLYTEFGAVVGTLEYMSPEQAELNQLDIDTRSDIYSLGVLLYELLTGSTPLEPKRVKAVMFLEVLRLIREEESPRPSLRLSTTEELPSIAACRHIEPRKLSGLVRGELDWIVMMALEKDRARRYETANGLAADLRRYLDDEPVQACPPSVWYRFGKIARRNKAALTTAVLVSLATVSAVVGLAVSNELIRREMKRTDHQRDQAVARAEALRRHDYISRVNLAYRECLASNVAQAQELLDGCPEDLRGWEWSYVSRQCHLDLHTFREPGPGVNAVAFSADGRYIASGSGDFYGGESGDLVVREVVSRREVFAHRGLPGGVHAVAFSSDGRWLAAGLVNWSRADHDEGGVKSGSRSRTARPTGTLILFDATTGQERFRKTETGRFGLFSLAFSPDSRQIVAGYKDPDYMEGFGPGYAKLWDATTGDLLIDRIPGPAIGVFSVAFSPDGKHVALAGKGQIDVRDLASRRLIRTLKGHVNLVETVTFSPDGRYLASGGSDRTVRLWDRATGAEVRTHGGHEGAVLSLAFSPDGQRFVSASGNSLKLWSVASGGELATLHGHEHPVQCVAISPDGSQIASGSSDQTVKLWFATPNLQLTFQGQCKDSVRGVAFSPDGHLIASVSLDGVLQLWDPATGEQRLTFERGSDLFGAVAFSPDGRRLATAGLGGCVEVWDTNTAANILALLGTKLPNDVEWPSVAYSPDGRRLALAANEQSMVKVFDAATGRRIHTLDGHSAAANVVAFSPDGRTLASAGNDKTVKLWDAATGQELLTLKGHAAPVNSVAFSFDGRRLASGGGNSHQPGEVIVWDCSTGRQVCQLHGHTDPVRSVAFSPDGRRLASAGDDLTIKLWDTAAGQEVFTLRGHTDSIYSIAFSPDGRRIASGAIDYTVKVWDLDESRADVLSRRVAVAEADSGESFLESGGWDQAATALTKALELKLDNPRLRLARGRALAHLGRHKQAEADFARALELTGAGAGAQLAQIHTSIGELFLEVARCDQAAAALSRALELKADNARIRLALGRAFARLGQSQKAGAEFTRAIELTKLPEACNNLAWVLVTSADPQPRDPSRAVQLAEKAVGQAPTVGAYWNTLGAAYYRAGNWNAAIEALTKSMERLSGKNESFNTFFLAMAHWQLGDKPQSRSWYDKAVPWMEKNRPENEELIRLRAEAASLLEAKEKKD